MNFPGTWPLMSAQDKVKHLYKCIAELEAELALYKNALWKACGDDEETVNATLESQR